MVPEEVGQVGDEGLEENHQGDPHVLRVAFKTLGLLVCGFIITVANTGMAGSTRPLESLGPMGETVTRQFRNISG